MKNVISTVLSIIAIVLLLYVTPAYYTGAVQWAKSQSEALAYTRDLIDIVIDTRQLTEDVLNDYALNMSSTSEYFKYTIIRKVKCVMPDPVNPGKTYSTYIVVDDISQYNQGDRIIVKVEPVGTSIYQIISHSVLGFASVSDGFTLPGRVR